jgi:hypothetical protein
MKGHMAFWNAITKAFKRPSTKPLESLLKALERHFKDILRSLLKVFWGLFWSLGSLFFSPPPGKASGFYEGLDFFQGTMHELITSPLRAQREGGSSKGR